jgi:multidrug efflux pump subunit AcrB
MKLVTYVLRQPYTVGAGVILLCILGVGAALRMPIDIFPEINIPVVSVVWTYAGMTPLDIQNRILTLHERQLASLVDDISRIEATSYYGVGVEKVYLHEGADVTRAVAQLASSALVVLKYMPANITPPLVLRYGATDVPIIQLSLSSTSLTDTKLNDLGQNTIRPYLAVVHGAQVPYPYGGKPRVIMVDLDQQALQARGLSPSDVAQALQQQNVILPSGDVKIGNKDYTLAANNSPDVISAINEFPMKEVDGRVVFVRDVAHVHDGYQIQTNSVAVDGELGALMMVRKTGGASTLTVIDGIKDALPYIEKLLPRGVEVKAIFDQSVFVKAALNSVLMGGTMAAGLTALMILLFLGNWRLTLIILASIPLSIIAAIIVLYAAGQTLNTMTLGGFALAVGILVDNGTVVIENIERHVKFGEPLAEAIATGCGEIGVPTMLSTLSISIVFVPIFLLQGTAKYLFSPLSLSVCIALMASLVLSFTLVPVLFNYLMRGAAEGHGQEQQIAAPRQTTSNPLAAIHLGFETGFSRFRENYRNSVAFCVAHSGMTSAIFIALIVCSLPLFSQLGRDFFPQVDAGQMRLHVRAPPGTRIETTQHYFAEVENAIRQIVGQTSPNFWVDPTTGVSYLLAVQVPTYRVSSAHDLWTVPVTPAGAKASEMLMNVAKFGRTKVPVAASQLNIMPVFDVHADVQGRDLASAATDIEKVMASEQHKPTIKLTLSGQVETMIESYNGLFSGMAFAVVLIYLILAINFQSWIDPLIVVMALPFALGGVIWMLFLTGTHLSVPALMGTLMVLGLATANSILVVTFANQRMAAGDDTTTAAVVAGFTRLQTITERPISSPPPPLACARATSAQERCKLNPYSSAEQRNIENWKMRKLSIVSYRCRSDSSFSLCPSAFRGSSWQVSVSVARFLRGRSRPDQNL